MAPKKILFLMVAACFTPIVFTGCGQKSGEVITVISSTASTECIGCHATNSRSISTTTGVKIAEQWQLSAHNTAKGAGCLDCHSSMHYHDYVTSCRSCHATAHLNNGNSCSVCHGGGAKEAASCMGCHADPHPRSGAMTGKCLNCHGGAIPVDVAMKNPDFAKKCYGCHQNGQNFKHYTAIGIRHFNNFTGSGYRQAMYVTTSYQNRCTACHEPHNPLLGLGSTERKAWANSGHGDVKGVAWSDRDFKNNLDSTSKTYQCIRCHTATGFINFVEGGLTSPFPSTTWASTGDTDREVLTCRACHTSGNFKGSVRQVPQFIAPYGFSAGVVTAPLVYPSVGESNLCIPCHSGRENGISIKKTVSNFANASFKNPHYLAAAAVFYGLGGFQFYSSTKQTTYAPQAYTTKYGVIADGTIIPATAASTSNSTPAIVVGDALVGEKAPWSHGKLGMNNFQSTKTTNIVAEKGNLVFTGTNGQCITCHLGSGAKPGVHSLNAFDIAKSTWTKSYMGCYGCHTNEDMEEVAHEERMLVDRAMAFFKWQLVQTGMDVVSNYPYFYQPGTTNALKNWNGLAVPGGSGAANMGAAMNYKLLEAEKGVHVHNRTYMKQLIFDSIQYLQTGKVTFSNRYITTNSKSSPNGLINFTAYSTAVTPGLGMLPNDIAAGASGSTISITQLKGYITRRNTGTGTPAAIGSTANPLYTRP